MSGPAQPLTERELDVLRLAATGYTHKGIAVRLHIGPLTVKNHFSSMFTKLGVRTAAAAVYRAVASGQLETDTGALAVRTPVAKNWRQAAAHARWARWYARACEGAPARALAEADGYSVGCVHMGVKEHARRHGVPYPWTPRGPGRQAWKEPA